MLMIRLQRVGRKHEPVFRLVLTDSKNSTKSGKFLEILGSYDARKAEDAKFDNDKILHLISTGAQLSDTVHNLLLKRGVIQGVKRNVLSRKPLTKAVEKAEEKTESVPAIPEVGELNGGIDSLVEPAPEEAPELAPEVEPAPEEIVERKEDVVVE